jgi:hypothetical protein
MPVGVASDRDRGPVMWLRDAFRRYRTHAFQRARFNRPASARYTAFTHAARHSDQRVHGREPCVCCSTALVVIASLADLTGNEPSATDAIELPDYPRCQGQPIDA